MLRRRIWPFAALALAVPVPALALTGGGDGATAAPAPALTVSASLETCGLAETAIVCKINAGWGSVEGAEYFTASVTRADGSVVDYGQVGSGGGTSVWVPYVGAGTYTVQVSAYGTPPGEDEPELVAKDSASAGTGGAVEHRGGGSATAQETDPDLGDRPGGDAQVEEPPAPCEPTVPEKPAEEPAPEDDPGAAQGGKGLHSLDAAETAVLAAEAELPDSIACPPAAG
jgi:hypothetical protein